MYAIAYGQCSEAMRAKLEGEEGYKEAETESDVIKLLKIIKRLYYQYQSQRYPHRAVHAAMQALYLTSQKDEMTLKQYLDKFLNRQDVLKQCRGIIGPHPGLTDIALKDNGFDHADASSYNAEDLKQAQRDAKEAYLAFVFLSNANKAKFAPLLRELANSCLVGNDEYPRSVSAAHKFLVGWEGGSYTIA
eukprot:6114552-Ditylum_brightwellii.AAC.1